MKHVRRITNYPGRAQAAGLSAGDILNVISQIAYAIAGAFIAKETAAAEEDEKVVPTTPDPPDSEGTT